MKRRPHSGAARQRSYVHFLRKSLDHLPRTAADDCLQELRWLYDRRNLSEAQKDLAQWLEASRDLNRELLKEHKKLRLSLEA